MYIIQSVRDWVLKPALQYNLENLNYCSGNPLYEFSNL